MRTMTNILYSKTKLDFYDTIFAIEFNDCISDLINLPDVQELANFSQHMETSRFQHSVNVAYYSYLLSKLFHLDYRSAARSGLLHDLFLYDWREVDMGEHHAFAHPKAALETAKKNTELSPMEEDAILKHMWPLCKSVPKYKESYIVSLADKYCCTAELVSSFSSKIKNTYSKVKAIFA